MPYRAKPSRPVRSRPIPSAPYSIVLYPNPPDKEKKDFHLCFGLLDGDLRLARRYRSDHFLLVGMLLLLFARQSHIFRIELLEELQLLRLWFRCRGYCNHISVVALNRIKVKSSLGRTAEHIMMVHRHRIECGMIFSVLELNRRSYSVQTRYESKCECKKISSFVVRSSERSQ